MQELWTAWNSSTVPAERYTILDINDALNDTFSIILTNTKQTAYYALTFKEGVLAHQCIHEPYRTERVSRLACQYGESLYKSNSLFQVKNSLYIEWFTKNITSPVNKELFHMALITDTLILDIIANEESLFEPVTLQTADENNKNTKNKSAIKVGMLEDGRVAKVRPRSKVGYPTLEIFDKSTVEIIRYTK